MIPNGALASPAYNTSYGNNILVNGLCTGGVARTFFFKNTGGSAFTINVAFIGAGGQWVYTNPSGTVVNAGASYAFTLTTCPLVLGWNNATINITTTNNYVSTFQVSAFGYGQPIFALLLLFLAFCPFFFARGFFAFCFVSAR